MDPAASEFIPGGGKIFLSTAVAPSVTGSHIGKQKFNPAAAEFVPSAAPMGASTAPFRSGGADPRAAGYVPGWTWPPTPSEAKVPSHGSAVGGSKSPAAASIPSRADQKPEQRGIIGGGGTGLPTPAAPGGAGTHTSSKTNATPSAFVIGDLCGMDRKDASRRAPEDDDSEGSDVNATDPCWLDIGQLRRRIEETREELIDCGVNPAAIEQQPEMKALVKRRKELEDNIGKGFPAVIFPFPLRPYVFYIMRLSRGPVFGKRLRQ